MKELFAVDLKGLFRGLYFSILGTALVFCLFFFAYFLVFNLITSKPGKVKGIVERSSLYADLPVVLYDQVSQEKVENSNSNIPLRDPEIRQIVLDVYDPQFVQSNTEKLIDGIYGWLMEETSSPQINLDFNEKNKEFANKIGKYAEKRAKELPVCGVDRTQSSEELNVFNVKCLPAHISPAAVRKDIAKADNTLLDSRLNADDIKTNDGRPLHETFANLPKSFSVIKNVPITLFILALILGGVAIYFSKDIISGLKRVSRTVLLAGVLIALAPVIFTYLTKSLLSKASLSDEAINIFRTLSEEFMRDAGKIYHLSGALFILIAVGLYVYAKKIERETDKIPKVKS
ncbi:MAG: hypothetical protein WD885_03350 [Candidatus Saccharimonadales bacterium]